MCKHNNVDEICQVHIADYITKQKNGVKPGVYFFYSIRGTILLSLLHEVDCLTIDKTTIPCPLAKRLISQPAKFWPLLTRCNLNFVGKDTRGCYNEIIISAFRNLVKYIQGKAIKHGAIVSHAGGWARNKSFKNEKQAGNWLLEKMNEDVSANVPKAASPTPRTRTSKISRSCKTKVTRPRVSGNTKTKIGRMDDHFLLRAFDKLKVTETIKDDEVLLRVFGGMKLADKLADTDTA